MEIAVAGAVVGKICEIAIDMAALNLAEAAKLVANFRKDLTWLNMQLIYLRGFLQNAAQQPQHSERVKQWLENIRDTSLIAEDICEECALVSMHGNDALFCGLNCKQCPFYYKTGRKIEEIKDRIRSLIAEATQLKLFHEASIVVEALQDVDWKKSHLLPTDSHPVGIKSKVDCLLELLNKSDIQVIAVVGMGGLGKTYLLQHLYNNTGERYDKSIWLSATHSCSISSLQKDLVFQLDEALSERIKGSGVSESVLAPLIHNKLNEKRCLVVLDDVWSTIREDELFNKIGLPTGTDSRCKIVVSTRSWEVCNSLNASAYEMKCLSDDESWSLFCMYAFSKYVGNRAPEQHREEIEEVGREIVKQCGYLPLAIKTIAASLANTTIPEDWRSKLNQLKGAVAANDDHAEIMSVLRLSYDSLPPRFKACFAYLAFFPENEEIECEHLINLWIAEGFFPVNQPEMAWRCLSQLANLCLIQQWEKVKDAIQTYHSLTKYCKIHDLLYRLAKRISSENKCLFSLQKENTSSDTSGSWCRILLAKQDIHNEAISESRPVCLRTLQLSQNKRIISIRPNFFADMKRLRVLDLSGTGISTLPDPIGKMKLLKHLNIRNTLIREVPECVKHLRTLLFLALSNECKQLPAWISELKYLQHLECQGVARRIPKEISELVSLRTLRSNLLELYNEEDVMTLNDFGNMTQLQELRLFVNHEMEINKVENGILARLVKMRRLVMRNGTARSDIPSDKPQLPKRMTEMKHLESLILEKFVAPSWICGLAYLRELELIWCDCTDYPELQNMSNLVRLNLFGNASCKKFSNEFGESGGFPNLRFFTIEHFGALEEFPELKEGAMPLLEEFRLWKCPKVQIVRERLDQLKRLKEFSYEDSGTNQMRGPRKIGIESRPSLKRR